jgi:hypothetical protein
MNPRLFRACAVESDRNFSLARPIDKLKLIGQLGGASARHATLTHNLLEPTLRIFISCEASLVETKSGGVVVTASVDHARRMLNMKHFVVEDKLREPFRHLSRIERLANGDRLVNAIVVTKNASRFALRPGKRGFLEVGIEVFPVQLGKHLIEVINVAVRAGHHLSPATATGEV